MTLHQFINEHKKDLEDYIKWEKSYDITECRLWILNDESLYLWAKSEGVKI